MKHNQILALLTIWLSLCLCVYAVEGSGMIIVAIILGLLLLGILGGVLYFLRKKGMISCGRSGKQEM